MRYTGTRTTFALSIIPHRHYNDNDRNNDRRDRKRRERGGIDSMWGGGIRTRRRYVVDRQLGKLLTNNTAGNHAGVRECRSCDPMVKSLLLFMHDHP